MKGLNENKKNDEIKNENKGWKNDTKKQWRNKNKTNENKIKNEQIIKEEKRERKRGKKKQRKIEISDSPEKTGKKQESLQKKNKGKSWKRKKT